jgi:hypothetical protein
MGAFKSVSQAEYFIKLLASYWSDSWESEKLDLTLIRVPEWTACLPLAACPFIRIEPALHPSRRARELLN